MPLDLEVIGEVRELAVGEDEVTSRPEPLQRLKDSHHSVARCVSAGLSDVQTSLQTGYTPQRVRMLRQDPTFRELVDHYRNSSDEVRMHFEHRMMLMAADAEQELMERLHDTPEQFSVETLIDVVKVHADRAGFAPVQRSINKNLNLNIGDRLDAARSRLAKETP